MLAFDLYPFFDILDEDTGMVVRKDGPEPLARGLEAALGGELPAPERVFESTRRRSSAEAVVPRLIEAYEETLRQS